MNFLSNSIKLFLLSPENKTKNFARNQRVYHKPSTLRTFLLAFFNTSRKACKKS